MATARQHPSPPATTGTPPSRTPRTYPRPGQRYGDGSDAALEHLHHDSDCKPGMDAPQGQPRKRDDGTHHN